jgi:cysteine rich repeat protein
MFRISFVGLFALVAAQVFVTPQASAQQGHDACARDVSRFCRALMNDGDSAVLGCLKQHRARLSRACDKVLTENGQ